MRTQIIMKTMALLLVYFFAVHTTMAQEKTEVDHSYKPLTLKLNEDGSKYIRFIMWHQIWATTGNLEAENRQRQITPSIRRSRFLAFAQVSPKFMILTHFGLNSLSPTNLTSLGSNGDSPQMFLHDAWGEFKVHDAVYVGAGLHYWKGLTRLSNQSTLNLMTLDQSRPFVAWHSLGITDQFARHLGIYAKGQIDKFDYRIALNAPLRNTIGAGIDFGMKESGLTYNGVTTATEDGDQTGNTVIEGYFRYNIFDKESTKLPYAVGTYLGKKKVLAIGAGFYAHPNGMYTAESDTTGVHSGVGHFALDIFADMPVGSNGDAANAYLALMNFNYGENYVSRWAGTGTALIAQAGYYLNSAKIMPYVGFNYGAYQGYDDPVTALNVGMNYFINGHFAKLTLEYHRIAGDVREGAIITQDDAISQIRLQMHIFL